jgi:V/A-type H+-transporting ATPase subunit A
MLRLVLRFHEEAQRAIGGGVSIEDILQLEVRERIARAKYVPEEELDRLLAIEGEITTQIDGLIQGIGGEKSA